MKKLSSRIIAGVIIIIVGVTMLLNNIGITHFDNIISIWWPLLFVLAGIVVFIDNPRSYLWAFILVLFGTLWQLEKLTIIQFSPWQIVWPAIIIAVGISITFSRREWGLKKMNKDERHDSTAILAGSDVKSSSPDFKGGKVTAIMGGAEYDLREAIIKKNATLEVFAFWGGIEIRVPKGVAVKNQTNNILGGTEDSSSAPEDRDAPVLHVVGDVIMSGVEIKN